MIPEIIDNAIFMFLNNPTIIFLYTKKKQICHKIKETIKYLIIPLIVIITKQTVQYSEQLNDKVKKKQIDKITCRRFSLMLL